MRVRLNYYLIAHALPITADPTMPALPEPKVVASITVDPLFVGKLDPYKSLKALAGQMGLVDFEITTAEAKDLPGHQLGLPFPPNRQRRKH